MNGCKLLKIFMDKKIIITIAIVSFLFLLFIGFIYEGKGFFTGNLLPEFLGIIVDILIIMFIVDRWKKQDDKKKQIDAEMRLREYLGFLLKNIFKELKIIRDNISDSGNPGKFYSESRTRNQTVITYLIDTVCALEQDEIDKLSTKVKAYCAKNGHFIECLIPIAAQLSKTHFKAWARICFYINELNSDSEQYTRKEIIVNILKNIDRFDKESFDLNLIPK